MLAIVSFNPRPPSLTGEPQDGVTEDRVIELFQSTPAIADGRTQLPPGAAPQVNAFQSTPAIADGRTRSGQHRPGSRAGFNPRPPSLTGEPRQRQGGRAMLRLFQSTPAIADGRTALERHVHEADHVSIHARHR